MMSRFRKISEIRLDNDHWQHSLFITLDVDWACDEVLSYTLDLFRQYSVPATILMTHETDLIADIKRDPLFELGIHPNYNFLLQGDFRYGSSYQEVLEYYLNIVPDAQIVRSHSITQSTHILDSFHRYGLKYDLNCVIPYSANMVLKPFVDWTKLLRLPYFWQEDIAFGHQWDLDPSNFTHAAGLKIFNFHPIHIFLNSANMSQYEHARPYLQNYADLQSFCNKQHGVQNFLLDLFGQEVKHA